VTLSNYRSELISNWSNIYFVIQPVETKIPLNPPLQRGT
jgi:hypothetical protein